MDRELIERLWTQAVREDRRVDADLPVERFDALIAEECAKVCDAEVARRDRFNDDKAMAGALCCANGIREKFKP